jgi:methionine synthase II (cobalamin-independent)
MQTMMFKTEAKKDIEKMVNEITKTLTNFGIPFTQKDTPNFFEEENEEEMDYAVRINVSNSLGEMLDVGIDAYDLAPESEQGDSTLAWYDWYNDYTIVIGC